MLVYQLLSPNAHTKSIVQPVTPTTAIILLPLFLNTSLIFHFVYIDAFFRIPFVVISKLVFFTLGISTLKACDAGSFNIFLHERYVTNVTNKTTITAKTYTNGFISVLYKGISKYVISISMNGLPNIYFPAITPKALEIKLITNP